jgi:hypothetical protein
MNIRNVSVLALLIFGLCACNSPQTASPISGTIPVVTAPVAKGQVVADAKKICGYVADAGPVVDIIASGTPGLSTADAIAAAICKAVASQPTPVAGAEAAPSPIRTSPPVVAGVVVTGRCVASGCRASF